MAMSDFRRSKLVYVFKAFFGLFTFPHNTISINDVIFSRRKTSPPIDVDNSGAIDQQDFRLAAEVY